MLPPRTGFLSQDVQGDAIEQREVAGETAVRLLL